VATVQQLNRKTLLPAAVLCLSLVAGCASQPQQPSPPAKDPPPAKGDPAALTVVAEVALEGGDCKKAAETYAQAAAIGAAPMLAGRATKVALACEHVPAAWQSATRWRALASTDREANALYAAVALKLYKVPEARAAISEYWRQTQAQAKAPEHSAVGKPGAARPTEEDAQDGLAELTQLLVDQSGDAPAVLAAMSSALEPGSSASAPTLALLGGLAVEAYDAKRAQRYAQQALERDPHSLPARRVLARAYVMGDDPAKAIATAREAMLESGAGAFELVDVLTLLDRLEEAHQELERLRGSGVPAPEIDRRLALLAFQAGDMKEAQQRFTELVSSGEGNDAAMLYLADIAARDGDTDAAIAGYRRLYDSSVAVPARSRAAGLLLAKKSRTEALTLLDDYAADHPDNEYELTLAKARLLAEHGEAETGLTLLSTALEHHPKHPGIEYERAVILEQAGHVHESIEAMEKLLAERPDDPTLLNSLGYTMADHSLELSRAEGLIKRALGTTPDNPAALDSLGWVHFRQGDAKAAAVTLGHAYSLGHDAEIAAHWGEALWVSGDHQQARKVWAQALAREPDSQSLKATLARFVDAPKSPGP
jgi:predicted Zn-dependent protease